MGTIVPRKRKDGTTGYTAQIRIKRGGKIAHTEAQTFARKQAAVAWLKRRETELAEPGALDRRKTEDPTLAEVIDRYTAESEKATGRTKAQVLRSVKSYDIGVLRCSEIGSEQWVLFAQSIDAKPQTVGNYMAHLGAIVAVARPAWGYPLDQQAFRDAIGVLKRLGRTSKSARRDRRPTLSELDQLMTHFADRKTRVPRSAAMTHVVAFAVFSTRRLEEILRMRWEDLDVAHSRVLVHDMKNPGEKAGNDVWCDLPPEALRVALAMPRDDKEPRIFPYGTDAVSAAFTRAGHLLGIADLHFHDLRHEGASRLIEMDWPIPRVAAVTGHRSWNSLQRYTHLKHVGDKLAGWKWLEALCANA